MQNTTNLSVDFQSHTITVSNSFLRRSRVVDSLEYSTLLRLMQELPGFQLETRRPARPSRMPYMPGYNEMMTRIRMTADAPAEALQEFERVREFARATGKGYMMVRAWFLDKYAPAPMVEVA